VNRERFASERGSALVELVGLGIVLLVPLTYVVLGVLQVQQAAYGVTAAAQAAGRAYMLAPSGAAAPAAASAAAAAALADQGLTLAPGQLQLSCASGSGDCRVPGGSVRVRIALRVGLPLLSGGRHTSVAVSGIGVAPYGVYLAQS
jgi:hypothetical protein